LSASIWLDSLCLPSNLEFACFHRRPARALSTLRDCPSAKIKDRTSSSRAEPSSALHVRPMAARSSSESDGAENTAGRVVLASMAPETAAYGSC
jgi:hypothetical protein